VFRYYHLYLEEAEITPGENENVRLNMPPDIDISRYPQGHLQLMYNSAPQVDFKRNVFRNNKGAFQDKVKIHHIWLKGPWTIESMCRAIFKGELYFCPIKMMHVADPKVAKAKKAGEGDDDEYKPPNEPAEEEDDDANLEVEQEDNDDDKFVLETAEDTAAAAADNTATASTATPARQTRRARQGNTPSSVASQTPRKRRKIMRVDNAIDVDKADESAVRAMLKLLLENNAVIDLTTEDDNEESTDTETIFASLGFSVETLDETEEDKPQDSKPAAK
jgi:hypothetical protein